MNCMFFMPRPYPFYANTFWPYLFRFSMALALSSLVFCVRVFCLWRWTLLRFYPFSHHWGLNLLWFIHRLCFCTISCAYICIASQELAHAPASGMMAFCALTLQLIFIITKLLLVTGTGWMVRHCALKRRHQSHTFAYEKSSGSGAP